MLTMPIQFTDEEWIFLLKNRKFSKDTLQALRDGQGALGMVSVLLDESGISEICAYAAQT